MDHVAVLVVGAGPVGLVLGCELARRGVPIRVIDTLPVPTTESRAILLHPRSLEMLERIGVVDEIIASGVRTTSMQFHASGRTIGGIRIDTVDSPYPFDVTTAQTETERILADRLASLGVKVERGVELTDFTQDASGVKSTLRHADGQVETVPSSWIVGTDGAHSTVRRQMGEQLEGSFVGENFLMGDVDADHNLPGDSMHSYFSPGDGPLLVFPMVGKRVRLIAQITRDKENKDASIERLQRVVDDRAGGITILSARWLTTFEIHHAQAPRYRVGRAFLAGDAAHVHSPAGGQGMNTGMQDAFNLGWKLAMVADGSAGDGLLDSYQAERHPVAAAVIASTTTLTNMGTLDKRFQQELRNHAMHLVTALAPVRHMMAAQLAETNVAYRGSAVVAGHGSHRGVRPGEAAPDVEGTGLRRVLDSAGHVALFFARRGEALPAAAIPTGVAGMRRVLIAGEPAEPSETSGFDAVIDDTDGRIARRYGRTHGGVMIVRPDGYIGFIGDIDDADAVKEYLTLLR
jgi:2-polyprenyl-6-methoxyphenol hydroxylase-like FAD-dependent oxidoreductase